MNDNAAKEKTKSASAESHAADALVLSCMDFRMTGHVTNFLTEKGLKEKYDIIAIAGAAIGVMNPAKSAWGDVFWEHVNLARDLHGIRRVIVIDHRDCGACKAFVAKDCAEDRINEFEIHSKWLNDLSAELAIQAPELQIELYLMDLDGSVEVIEAVS